MIKNIEQVYVIIIGAVFLLGSIFGATLFYTLSEDCKGRKELCALDIKQNDLLKKQLTEAEKKCFLSIDSSVQACVEEQGKLCDTKLKRIESACNDLDCAQCRR